MNTNGVNTSSLSRDVAERQMHVSVREAKLITERLLMLTGIDLGLIPAVRDFLLSAQHVGESVFEFMDEEFPSISHAPQPKLSREPSRGGPTSIDGHDQYAMFVGPNLLDLIAEDVVTSGSAFVRIRNVRYPNLLRGIVLPANQLELCSLVSVAGPQGQSSTAIGFGDPTCPVITGDLSPTKVSLLASVDHTRWDFNEGDVLILASRAQQQADYVSQEPETLLAREQWHALVHGYKMAEKLWWSLYHRSSEALTRTSELSRTHAGRQQGDRTNDPDWY